MPYYTWIDKETCIACGVCGTTAPDIFDYDDEGIAYAKWDDNTCSKKIPRSLEDDVIDAHQGCPTESVKILEKPEKVFFP